MSVAERVRESLLGMDPGLVRAKLASRVVLGIFISLSIIFCFSHFVHAMPTAAYGLGMILSIQGVLVVREPAAVDQAITRSLGVVAAMVSASIATLLEDHRIVSDLSFLVIIFAASIGRAFGARWNAVGMYGFMAYFMSAYFHPAPADLPWVFIGIVVSAGVAQTVRFVVLPDNRLKNFQGIVTACLRRSDQIVEDLIEIAERGRMVREDDAGRLRRRARRLKDTILMAHGALGNGQAEHLDEAQIALQTNLVELQLAAESVIVASANRLPNVERLKHALNGEEIDDSSSALNWLVRARRDVWKSAADLTELAPPKPVPAPEPVRLTLRHQAVITAVQITLASAIAMGAGLALSRDRWFWAVLSAFLVFINSRSRGDTTIKGAQRALGTLVGIVVGLALAFAIGNHPYVSSGLALVSLFLAFYNLPVSYARMTFFISVVIALAYSLMGVLTIDLMVLRIEETLIGSLAGILVSATVFPSKTRVPLEKAVADWYAALKSLLEAMRSDQGDRAQLVSLSQKLDASYAALVDAARPIGTRWQVVTKPGRVRQTLALFLAATYWARLSARGRSLDTDGPADERIDILIGRIEALKGRAADCFYLSRHVHSLSAADARRSDDTKADELTMLEATLARLYPR